MRCSDGAGAGVARIEQIAVERAIEDGGREFQTLAAYLDCLDEISRETVILAYHEARSRDDLEARFTRPVNTVKTQLRRAILALGNRLEGRGMASPHDTADLLVAERALGLEPLTGEMAEEARARRTWEARLAPLADALGSLPAPNFPDAIERRIALEPEHTERDRPRAITRRWQMATSVPSLAAGVVVYLAPVWGDAGGPRPADETQRYVAVARADADPSQAATIIDLDPAQSVTTVMPLVDTAAIGRGYKMWHLRSGASQSISLGLLPERPAALQISAYGRGETLAISRDPAGGSPTGLPALPLFHGTIREID